MNRSQTRDRLTRIGRDMVAQQGFNHTGINAVLSSAQVPKGSFYYYFASKEDFGRAIIEDFAADYGERLATLLGDADVAPLQRIRNYLDSSIEEVASAQCTRGCLIGNLGQELAGQSDVFRQRLEAVFRKWEEQFANCLKAAKEAGEIAPDSDAEQLASFLLAGWEGAILRAKVTKSVAPMQAFKTVFFDRVVKPVSR